MNTRIHAIASTVAFITILAFWSATVWSEIFGSDETITQVKGAIAWGVLLLIPSMVAVGISGNLLGKGRTTPPLTIKRKRMAIVAANGILVLVPSALFLASRSNAGMIDEIFYGVQALELAAGTINMLLMGKNIRDGLMLSKRFKN